MRVFNNRVPFSLLLWVAATGLPQAVCAVSCKQVDAEALKRIILTTSDPRVVLIAASIGQQQVLPALRTRMRPDDLSTPEGAAEAAARLGDQRAVSQLKVLLDKRNAAAARILGYAGTEQTLRIGFDYLLAHEKDPNKLRRSPDRDFSQSIDDLNFAFAYPISPFPVSRLTDSVTNQQWLLRHQLHPCSVMIRIIAGGQDLRTGTPRHQLQWGHSISVQHSRKQIP